MPGKGEEFRLSTVGTMGIEAHEEIVRGKFGFLTEYRGPGSLIGKIGPSLHLLVGESLERLGNLRKSTPAHHLGGGHIASRVTLYRKDGTAACLASRNALC